MLIFSRINSIFLTTQSVSYSRITLYNFSFILFTENFFLSLHNIILRLRSDRRGFGCRTSVWFIGYVSYMEEMGFRFKTKNGKRHSHAENELCNERWVFIKYSLVYCWGWRKGWIIIIIFCHTNKYEIIAKKIIKWEVFSVVLLCEWRKRLYIYFIVSLLHEKR